ncbi:C-terminal binding protein [Oceanobacillus alkalisoli]|uniref:C-terminal binding protein n=1 Tax=Oceanobacillus alkalisoli TaxID=2925113 RepID=UPI001F11F7B2|nr:C-terminal binding protein [Oceanobacillus alkalisoli]MCF3942659.1 C-terminal binding protein [Oceanobacillus alkalisoli]
MKKAIVVDKDYGSVTDKDLDSLRKRFAKDNINLELAHFDTEEKIIAECQDAEAILGTGNPPITEKVLSSLPNLKVIQRFGIGVNSIDLQAATKNNKVALFMPGFCVDELAAHATSLILSLIRNTTYYDRSIRNGKWPKATYFAPKAVPEMTLGLYGFGGSARPLYQIFRKGFGSRVITCDPYIPEAIREQFDVEFVDFDTMLKESDVISIHAPLNDMTRHIFSHDAFRKMKNDAMIINIARGPLIDEEALIKALTEEEIRFAGLDVFESEPISKDSKLLKMENVILTPHSAFYGEGSKRTQLNWAYELVSQALNERRVQKKYVANGDICNANLEFTFE